MGFQRRFAKVGRRRASLHTLRSEPAIGHRVASELGPMARGARGLRTGLGPLRPGPRLYTGVGRACDPGIGLRGPRRVFGPFLAAPAIVARMARRGSGRSRHPSPGDFREISRSGPRRDRHRPSRRRTRRVRPRLLRRLSPTEHLQAPLPARSSRSPSWPGYSSAWATSRRSSSSSFCSASGSAPPAVAAGLGLILVYVTGFLVLSRSYQHGRAIFVTAVSDLASRLVAIVVGIGALGERLSADPLPRVIGHHGLRAHLRRGSDALEIFRRGDRRRIGECESPFRFNAQVLGQAEEAEGAAATKVDRDS